MNSPYRTHAPKEKREIPFWCNFYHKWHYFDHDSSESSIMEGREKCSRCGAYRLYQINIIDQTGYSKPYYED